MEPPDKHKISQSLFGISPSPPSKQTSILTFKLIKPPSSSTKLYYDLTYNRIISIKSDNMKIYNRSFTKLKKNCDLIITNDYISKISTNKPLTYSLFLLMCSPQSLIMCADLNSLEFISILKDSFSNLLNLFFINETDFCLIYTSHLDFYTIDRSSTDIIIKLHSINLLKSNYLIQSYVYRYHIKLLLLLLSDNSFQIYNLKDKKLYYHVTKSFTVPFKSKGISLEVSYFNGKSFSSLFNNTKRVNDANTKIIDNMNNTYNTISKSQFYLERIYEEFYFVFLSYEKSKIYFIEIVDLFTFPKYENSFHIEYKQHNRNSYLYFNDNLVFCINFSKKEIIIIDIHRNEKNKILITCNYNTKIFNNINDFIPYGSIFKLHNDDKFFYLYFNKELYCNKFSKKLKIQCLFDMSRRKHFKEFIIKALIDILSKSTNKFKIIHKYLALVKFIDVMQDYESMAMKLANMNCNGCQLQDDVDDNRMMYGKVSIVNYQYEIERPTGLELLSKKQPILQSDLHSSVLQPIYENKKYGSLEELLYVVYGFISELDMRNVRVNGNYFVMMNTIIMDIYEKERNMFRYYLFVRNIAKYNFGEIGDIIMRNIKNKDRDIVGLGFGIWFAFHKYYEIFEYLIKSDDSESNIVKGLGFLMEYRKYLDKKYTSKIKTLLSNAILNKPNKRQLIIKLLKHK